MRPLEPLSRDYEIISLITETERSRVLLARRKSDNLEVVIKALRATVNQPEELLRFRREYGMLMELSIEGVVKIYDLRELDGAPALVLEYFRGMNLQQFLARYKNGLPLKTFFPLAMHIVAILSEVHRRGILHLDIKPSNILVAQDRVCLTDFGISRQTGSENLILLEGTLPYMAPEQTGKTSFPVDQRSDLYSLGVVFYEMVAGKRPFSASDIGGWVHAHLAEKSAPLSEVCSCPEALSQVIMKLLEKDPEKRYQSASGLLYDLHALYQAFQKGKELSSFVPATRDFSPEIRFSRTWYGRENSRNELSETIRRAILGSLQHVVLIGEKGIGKTLLINTVAQDFQNREMWHIRVTFSQERTATPYHGLRQFLYDTVQQMYLLPLTEQQRIKSTWEEKLKNQGKVLTSFLPEMEKLFTVQEEVENLDQEATQKRLFYLFAEFVSLLISKKRPLLLVLDHIQWADRESQKLFAHLCRQSLSYVCIITVFQGDESQWQEFSPRMEGSVYRTIVLSPWEETHITTYLATLLRQKESSVQSLAHLLFEKTGGTPGKLENLLEKLKEAELLYLDGYKGWKWDEQAIAGFELQGEGMGLEHILSSLDEDSRRALVITSVLGNRFPTTLFQEIVGVSREEMLSLLFPFFEKRLLSLKEDMVYWNHPSTREGLYASLHEKEKASAHALVASYFFQQNFEHYEDKLYFVFDHVLKGLSEFSTAEERNIVFFLTSKVVEQNKQTGAFAATFEVLSLLLDRLPPGSESDFFLPLYEAYAESAYYTANYDTLEKILKCLKEKGYDELVCFDLWVLLMKALGSQERYEDATKLFYHLAHLLSLQIPQRVSLSRILSALGETLWRMRGLSENQLKNLPHNTHPLVEKQAQLLFAFSPLAFWSSPLLNVFVNLVGTKLSLRYGLLSQSPFFFIACGIIMAGLGTKSSGTPSPTKDSTSWRKWGTIPMPQETILSTIRFSTSGFIPSMKYPKDCQGYTILQLPKETLNMPPMLSW